MKNIGYILTFIVLFLLTTCSSVPITGRKQLSLVSDQEVLTSSFQQYGEFIKTAPLSSNSSQTALVQKVGRRIADAVEAYLKNNGMASEIANYKWEFNLVRSSDVNAFCMPGGKIVVYEGILPYTQDETGLAVVLGHEVAHAVAKHSNERMSQELVRQNLGNALSSSVDNSSIWGKIISTSYGLGSQGFMLKYSRNHELEADHLGLIFMAMAGYDPSKAANFWLRMSSSSGEGGVISELMSTHPSDSKRISEINKHLSDALKYYAGPGKTSTGPTNPTSSSNLNKKENVKTSKEWTF